MDPSQATPPATGQEPASSLPPQEPNGGSLISRPEGLPEQFWDDATKTIKFDALGKSFNELSAFQAEQQSRTASVPETPDGYELKFPANFKPPEGTEFVLDDNDPMFAFAKQLFHQNGLSQAAFENAIGEYANMQIAEMQVLENCKSENMKALGPKAEQRVSSIKNWISSINGNDAVQSFEFALMTKTGIETFEKMMHRMSGGSSSPYSYSGKSPTQPKTTAELFYPNQNK